jgi:HEAT repeat protein
VEHFHIMTHIRLAFPRPRPGPLFAAALGCALVAVAAVRAQRAEGLERPLPPNVETFRQALLQERKAGFEDNPELLKYRRKNLTEKAAKLTSLVELSRALLLLEWAGSENTFNPKLAILDAEVRDDIAKRFKAKMEQTVADAPDDQKMAAAQLLGESAVNARKQSNTDISSTPGGDVKDATERKRLQLLKVRFLKDRLSELAPTMVALTQSKNPQVRQAGAAALGLILPDPAVSVPALEKMLESKNVADRRSAATALRQQVEIAADEQRKSLGLDVEPIFEGDSKALLAAQIRGQMRGEPIRTGLRVVPAAARGVTDPDSEVRRQSTEAWQQAALALSDLIRDPFPPGTFPPPDRPLDLSIRSDQDWNRRIEEERKANIYREELRPILRSFLGIAPVLSKAVDDPDQLVRRSAQRTLENLANVRTKLTRFEKSVPPAPTYLNAPKDGKDKDKSDKDKEARRPLRKRGASENLQAISFVDEKADKRDEQPDPITENLKRALPAVIKGLSDPDLQTRLASVSMLESMGADADAAIPALVEKGLKDRSTFVRWGTARTLGKIAPKQPNVVVPALAEQLTAQDLDLRIAVAEALKHYGKDAIKAVPALVNMVSRGDAESRVAMLDALAAIGPEAGPALPAATRALKDKDPRVRTAAASMIATYGPNAVKYVADLETRLRDALKDSDSDVRLAVSEALLRVGGR